MSYTVLLRLQEITRLKEKEVAAAYREFIIDFQGSGLAADSSVCTARFEIPGLVTHWTDVSSQ